MASGDIILHSPLCPSCLNDPTTVNSVNNGLLACFVQAGIVRRGALCRRRGEKRERERRNSEKNRYAAMS